MFQGRLTRPAAPESAPQMNSPFDLDLSFADEPAEPDLSGVEDRVLVTEVQKLPDALRAVASGILVERRTMSDVSQELGIRQAELVRRLHRGKHAIAESLAL